MCFPPIFHWVPLLLGCLVLTFAGKAGGHPQVVLVDDINAEASKFKMPRTSLAFWILLTCDDIDQQSLRLHIKIHPSLFCRLYSGVGYGRIWTSSCNNWRGTSVAAESLLPESHVKSSCWTCFHMTAPWLLKRGMKVMNSCFAAEDPNLVTHVVSFQAYTSTPCAVREKKCPWPAQPHVAYCDVLCVFVRNC